MNEKLKTIVFVQTQAENAGAQEISRQLANGVKAKGWGARQIFLFRRTDSFDHEEDTFFCANERPSSIYGLLSLMFRLFFDLRRVEPDAIVTFQHFGNLIAAPIARLAGVRLIVANQVSAPRTVAPAVRFVDKVIGCFGAYDHIVVNSAVTETDYERYPSAYSCRLVRIDHGFLDKSATLEKSAARRALGLPEAVELLGCAARLHPLKQLDLAIRVLTVNSKQHLALAGQGQDRARLETMARELGVAERVHFCDELGGEAMGAFLAAIDCFVFPSAAETFGLAPVEAAQAGVPVVANDLDALRDTLAVESEPCALFVDASDTQSFAAAVRRVFDDDTLTSALSARGLRLVDRFPLDKMVGAYLNLIEAKPA
ncbi:MAG: glycosyltransferase family 4 protein [Methylocystis sp.]